MPKCLPLICILAAIFTIVSCPSLSAAKSKKIAHKPAASPHSTGLTTAQKAAALAALKSLNKLQAATEVGVSYVDYSSRLIDVKAEVSDNLENVPDGQLKQKINSAMDAYADARTAWGEIIEYGYWDVLKDAETGKIVSKYKLDEGDKPIWSWDTTNAGEKEMQEMVAAQVIPAAIWSLASDSIVQAKALVK